MSSILFAKSTIAISMFSGFLLFKALRYALLALLRFSADITAVIAKAALTSFCFVIPWKFSIFCASLSISFVFDKSIIFFEKSFCSGSNSPKAFIKVSWSVSDSRLLQPLLFKALTIFLKFVILGSSTYLSNTVCVGLRFLSPKSGAVKSLEFAFTNAWSVGTSIFSPAVPSPNALKEPVFSFTIFLIFSCILSPCFFTVLTLIPWSSSNFVNLSCVLIWVSVGFLFKNLWLLNIYATLSISELKFNTTFPYLGDILTKPFGKTKSPIFTSPILNFVFVLLSIDSSKFFISGSTWPSTILILLVSISSLSTFAFLVGLSSTAFLNLLRTEKILSNFFLSFFVISLFISSAFLSANLLRYFSNWFIVPLKVAPKVPPKPIAVKYSCTLGNFFSSISFLIVSSVPAKVPPKRPDCLIPFQPLAVEPKGIACTTAAAKASP